MQDEVLPSPKTCDADPGLLQPSADRSPLSARLSRRITGQLSDPRRRKGRHPEWARILFNTTVFRWITVEGGSFLNAACFRPHRSGSIPSPIPRYHTDLEATPPFQRSSAERDKDVQVSEVGRGVDVSSSYIVMALEGSFIFCTCGRQSRLAKRT